MNQGKRFPGINLYIILAVLLLAQSVSASETGELLASQAKDAVEQSGNKPPDFVSPFKMMKVSAETPSPFILFTEQCYDACTAEKEKCRKSAIDSPPTGGWAVHYLSKCNRAYRMCLLKCDREHQVK